MGVLLRNCGQLASHGQRKLATSLSVIAPHVHLRLACRLRQPREWADHAPRPGARVPEDFKAAQTRALQLPC